MKFKSVLLAFVLAVSSLVAKADEGMWLPMLIGKNYADMKKQGFKLTPEDIYNINKASLKDAIVWFGGFCTGEIVSDKGLVLTNHHCGYDVITKFSTPENNILDNGFYAETLKDEKPAEGLFVKRLVRMADVSDKMLSTLKGLSGKAKDSKLAELSKILIAKSVEGTHYEADVKPFYKGNAYYLLVYEKFTDIRLVGAPPQSIGKFGGDTDNWEWPRHTGDFSMFRIYAGKDNKPAEYSEKNTPYNPKKYLKVSIAGIEKGDFAMVFGFPGRTNRYESSYGVELAINKINPAIVKVRDIRLKAWKQQMNKSDSVRLLLSSNYANIANYWKYYIGQTEQLKRLDVVDYKKEQEKKFMAWADGKSEYEGIFVNLEKAYEAYRPYAPYRTYLTQGVLGSTLAASVFKYMPLMQILSAPTPDKDALNKSVEGLKKGLEEFFHTFNEPSDRKILAQTLLTFYQDIPEEQHPAFIAGVLEQYGAADPAKAFEKYADFVFDNSFLASKEKTEEFLANPDIKTLQADPGMQYTIGFYRKYMTDIKPHVDAFNVVNKEEGSTYMKGLLIKNEGEKLMYPDANSTMRLTYGNVQGYSPRDAVWYEYYTTIDGVMEKYKPGDYEFDLPANYLELYKAKDYGKYAENGTLPVGFITNNDITGGNSGSPVLNAKGELIGLAFDGNWEAMSGDIVFDKEYKRCINVDIRYVLWCIDKLGGAEHLIKEMKIVK